MKIYVASMLIALRAVSAQPAVPFVGVDANYSLGMEKEGQAWQWKGEERELFKGMSEQGVRGLRVRLWTKDEGPHGKRYATEVVERALAAGLDPYLVIFLSEDWADLMKQPAPAIWKDLDLARRAEAVKSYSRESVVHFREHGLRSHLYEIGNEIDYGICGVYPGKSTKKNPESLRRQCWPQAAKLIRASQAGVLEADREAKFMLHIAHWWDAEFVIAFFEFMLAHDVKVDFAGLSYFPSSNIGGSLEMAQFGAVATALNAAIQRPIIVPETAYPSTSDFKGQFARWKKEVPGYPLSPDGQRRWISDFLDFCAHHPAIASVFYWSPEWCGDGMWKGMTLFDPDGKARPAWSAFAKSKEQRSSVKTPMYYQVQDGQFHIVPVEEARQTAEHTLADKLKQYGRVDVDYIKDISAADVAVKGYQVDLRASLSGNLDLKLKSDAEAVHEWKAELKKLDPSTQRAVIFSPDPNDTLLKEILALAQSLDLEAAVHPILEGKALKFGLSGAGR